MTMRLRDRIVAQSSKIGSLCVGIIVASVLALLAVATQPGTVEAQSAGSRVQVRGFLNSWAALSATGSTSAFRINAGARVHTTSIVVTGAPATCTARLQGSNDGGTTWFNITAADITCTSTIVSTTVDVAAMDVRFTVLTLTGGTSPTVRAHYAGS